MAGLHMDGLDHLVLTVSDLRRTCEFYTRVLGMREVSFGEGRTALLFGDQKINLHPAGGEFEPKAARPGVGSGDFCLITSTPLAAVLEELAAHSVPVELGPVQRTGARGPLLSVYCRDPDGNLVEIANYL